MGQGAVVGRGPPLQAEGADVAGTVSLARRTPWPRPPALPRAVGVCVQNYSCRQKCWEGAIVLVDCGKPSC